MSKAQRKARKAMDVRAFVGSPEFKEQGGSAKDAKALRQQWNKRDGRTA